MLCSRHVLDDRLLQRRSQARDRDIAGWNKSIICSPDRIAGGVRTRTSNAPFTCNGGWTFRTTASRTRGNRESLLLHESRKEDHHSAFFHQEDERNSEAGIGYRPQEAKGGYRDMTRRPPKKTHRQMVDAWKRDPEFKAAYAELETEYSLLRELLMARERAGLTQSDVAKI